MRRALLLVLLAIAVSCSGAASSSRLDSSSTPAQAPVSGDAARAVHAAWRGLPDSPDGCSTGLDLFPAGGLVSFYCHARTLLPLERLEKLAGISSTRSAPSGAAPAEESAFRHYDVRFVEWLRAALLPARADPAFRAETQPVYDRYVAPLARTLLATRRLVTSRREWLDAEVRWVRDALARRALPSRYYAGRYDLVGGPASSGDGSQLVLDPRLRLATPTSSAVAFWIRRELDGSAPAFEAALEELVSIYDATWLRAGAGVVGSGAGSVVGEPGVGTFGKVSELGRSEQLCGSIREIHPAPPYVFLLLATDDGPRWAALAAREFRTNERICLGEMRIAESFHSTPLGRTFDRLWFGVKVAESPARPPRPAPAAPSPPADSVLAEGIDVSIRVSDFEAIVAAQPPLVRSRLDSLEKKRELLDGLVRFRLLLAEARRRGLDRDPEVAALVEKVMVQRFVQRFMSDGREPPPTEDQLRAAYTRWRGELTLPEKVQLELRQPIAPAGTGLVTTPFSTRAELASRYGDALASAAFGLAYPGDTAPAIETKEGIFDVRLLARRAAIERSFEQVREQIAQRLARERRSKGLEALEASLREKANVKIDENALDRLHIK